MREKTKNKTLTQAPRNAAQSITSFWLFPEIFLSFLMRIIVPVLDYKTGGNFSPLWYPCTWQHNFAAPLIRRWSPFSITWIWVTLVNLLWPSANAAELIECQFWVKASRGLCASTCSLESCLCREKEPELACWRRASEWNGGQFSPLRPL